MQHQPEVDAWAAKIMNPEEATSNLPAEFNDAAAAAVQNQQGLGPLHVEPIAPRAPTRDELELELALLHRLVWAQLNASPPVGVVNLTVRAATAYNSARARLPCIGA